MSYDPSVPVASQSPGAFPAQAQTNFSRLQTLIGADHQFNLSAAGTDGYHKVVHFANQGSDPATVANTGELYTKTVGSFQQLFYQNAAGNKLQLTNYSTDANANARFAQMAVVSGTNTGGWTFLPGGLLLQYGQKVISSSGNTTVTYPIPFTSEVFSFTISCQRSSNPSNVDVVYVNNTTSSLSQAVVYSTSSGNIDLLYWMAIGI